MTNNISIFSLITLVLLLEYYFQKDKKPKKIPDKIKPNEIPRCGMYNDRPEFVQKKVEHNQNQCAHIITENEISKGIKKELETFKDGKYMRDVDEIIGNVNIGTYK